MTPLSDGARIREQLTLLAKEAVGPPGFEITEEKRAALVDAATVFFEAWSSPTAADYLRKIAPYRVPLTYPADGQAVLSCYQPLTGRSLPLDLTAEEVLDQFWRGRPDCPARPTMASFGMGEAIIDFTLRNNDRGPREITRWGRLSDDSISEKWIGPISGGGPCVSAPSVGYEEVRREHGPEIESAFIGCIAQCTDGHRCVMQLYWYWSPGSRQWHLRTVGFVTTHETFLWAF
jgi:hypothetical protein